MVLGINLYGANNIYLLLFGLWGALITVAMLVVFFGFANGGFLHNYEEKIGIRDEEHDEHLEY